MYSLGDHSTKCCKTALGRVLMSKQPKLLHDRSACHYFSVQSQAFPGRRSSNSKMLQFPWFIYLVIPKLFMIHQIIILFLHLITKKGNNRWAGNAYESDILKTGV